METTEGESDGREIFDANLISALEKTGVKLDVLRCAGARSYGIPVWKTSLPKRFIETIRLRKSDGYNVILSHEKLFDALAVAPIDIAIVHNYFAAFDFPEQRWLASYYRLGAMSFFGRRLPRASVKMFLSYRDARECHKDLGLDDTEILVVPPPPWPVKLAARRIDQIHISGTSKWRAKRLCDLTEQEGQVIAEAGYDITDFCEPTPPAFALITDRFRVGFKLKLSQMIHNRDVIASFCDLQEEVDGYAPGYPFYKTFAKLSDALDWFDHIKRSSGAEGVDNQFRSWLGSYYERTWEDVALKLVDRLARAP